MILIWDILTTCYLDWVGILDENTELNLRVLGEYVKMKQGTPAF